MRVTFKSLSPGNYAIAVLHDENNDRQANRNFLGLPTEGFGFSRNPAIGVSAPGFLIQQSRLQVKTLRLKFN